MFEKDGINTENDFEMMIMEFTVYNASPFSFGEDGGYKYVVVEKPDGITGIRQLKNWILQHHKKWDAALAVTLNGQTVIGGWAST